jgi:hypothetical protein
VRKRRILFSTVGIVIGLIVAWFSLVDLSWFVESCPDCGSDWDSIQYRFFQIPISERRHSNTMMLELVCADLGVPCTHPNLIRRHKQRRWGLCICWCPCHNGIDGLAGDADDYDQTTSARVRAMAKENPKLGEEFRQRVLVEHDYDYWHALANE